MVAKAAVASLREKTTSRRTKGYQQWQKTLHLPRKWKTSRQAKKTWLFRAQRLSIQVGCFRRKHQDKNMTMVTAQLRRTSRHQRAVPSVSITQQQTADKVEKAQNYYSFRTSPRYWHLLKNLRCNSVEVITRYYKKYRSSRGNSFFCKSLKVFWTFHHRRVKAMWQISW